MIFEFMDKRINTGKRKVFLYSNNNNIDVRIPELSIFEGLEWLIFDIEKNKFDILPF